VGLFLTVQEAVSALLRPATGWMADHWGYRPMIATGLLAVGAGLALVPHLLATPYDITVAVLVGFGHAAFVPAFMALVAITIDARHRGAAFGLLGATRNLGKIAGPVGGGVLIATLGHASSFYVLATVPLLAAALVMGRQGAKWISQAVRIDIPS
jgi:MFS family permease